MKMYELFLNKQSLGIFKEEPEKVIYCDWTTDGFNLLCFKLDEWKRLQEKIGFTSTKDEYKNFNAIFDSKFCIEKNYIEKNYIDINNALWYFEKKDVDGKWEKLDDYRHTIKEIEKTFGKEKFPKFIQPIYTLGFKLS